MLARLAIKADVDTERGTRDGVLPLAECCQRHGVPATFLFSLGPDNMGKSIYRLFQPGFLVKVLRTRVASNYGLSTLLNGTLKPAPHLGRRFGDVMRRVRDLGFEVGIHCHDHFHWQNHLHRWPAGRVREEFQRAVEEFTRVFGEPPRTAGAPGWQCCAAYLAAIDESSLLYASDSRGTHPFRPRMDGRIFTTPQIPTTLPTLDELLGRPEFPEPQIVPHYLMLLGRGGDHLLTVHAELEGLRYRHLFESLVARAAAEGFGFYSLRDKAVQFAAPGATPLPVHDLALREFDGRAGMLAVQVA